LPALHLLVVVEVNRVHQVFQTLLAALAVAEVALIPMGTTYLLALELLGKDLMGEPGCLALVPVQVAAAVLVLPG
jgi:hypothetical protein